MRADWKHKQQSEAILVVIAKGLMSMHTRLRGKFFHELNDPIRGLLQSKNPEAVWSAAILLSEQEGPEHFIPVMLRLLECDNLSIRLESAKTLYQWGYKDQSAPTFLFFIKEKSMSFRWQIMELFTQSGVHAASIPELLEILKSETDISNSSAESVLSAWGKQVEAEPALFELLNSNIQTRVNAACVLAAWGYTNEIIPTLIDLLKSGDSKIKLKATQVLINLGYKAEAMSALLGLLDSEVTDECIWAGFYLIDLGERKKQVQVLVRAVATGINSWLVIEALSRCEADNDAVQELLNLLKSENEDSRLTAASILIEWGHAKKIAPNLFKLLPLKGARDYHGLLSRIRKLIKNDLSMAKTIFSELGDTIPNVLAAVFRYKPDLQETWLSEEQRKAAADILAVKSDSADEKQALRKIFAEIVIQKLAGVD